MQDELLNTQDRLTRRRGFARWALIATLLAAVVVMLGAWTRLVDAGLGCPDWPGCYGFLHVPQTPAQIAIAEARFPEAPVDVAKGWPEMIHRYFAGSLGLAILGMTVFAIRHRREALPVRHCIGLLALVTLQAAFGMWTVTLQLWPQIVAMHLLGGFATLSLLFLLALRMSAHHPPLPILAEQRLLRLRPWLWLSLLLVIAQIALGAWTAANYAAVACTDFPGCHGALWPEMDVRHGFDIFQQIGPNYLGGQLESDGRVAIHMFHRAGALVVLVVCGLVLGLMLRATAHTPLAGWVLLTGLVLLAQIGLGIANVVLHLPLAIAVAHNAVGAALLLCLINLIYRVHRLRAPVRRPTVVPLQEVRA